MSPYYELTGYEPLRASSELTIPRMIAISQEITRNRNFDPVSYHKRQDISGQTFEALIFDITVDAIPSKNAVGIKYTERLAVIFSDDINALVEVFALRKDFPTLMHLNAFSKDFPKSLCLYFENATSVYRTWTPQNFLRRLQWWLEMSSKNQLHPSDQPVEQLFFQSKYELVLPWNLDSLIEEKSKLSIVNHGQRVDGGFTFLLYKYDPDFSQNEIDTIFINLPPILHGTVETDPFNLGELVEMLRDRGPDVLKQFEEYYSSGLVPPEGVDKTTNKINTLIFLRIPICRDIGAPPERYTHRAFLIENTKWELGVALGYLFLLKNKYFSSIGLKLLGSDMTGDWEKIKLFPLHILHQASKARARFSSGIEDEGPQAALIGVGSLGSALINFWVRSGWGKWTIIDKDHVKPHNLNRHLAVDPQVGVMKVDAVREILMHVTGEDSPILTMPLDACKLENTEISSALSNCSLVVDASADIEYPRLASVSDALARHVSVFITPDGNSSVLLLEDSKRKTRLRALEAQYYRAIINSQWGETHLSSSPSNFWSGGSCRDISLVMPYESVMLQASLLSNFIRTKSAIELADISVWSADKNTGEIDYNNIRPDDEISLNINDYLILYDSGLFRKLMNLRNEKLPEETGGVLVGFYDLNRKSVSIVDAIGATSDSISSESSFQRGTSGLSEQLAAISKKTKGMVSYIGEWHSHPEGVSTMPSNLDIKQLSYLSMKMSEDGLPAIQLIVGDSEINILMGEVFNQ